MSWFAQLTKDNIVQQVSFSSSQHGEEGELWYAQNFGGIWKETFENGRFRKRFAGIDYIYKQDTDEFIPPKPYSSWVWSEERDTWNAPIQPPQDGKRYKWIEETNSWIESIPE